MITCTHLQIDGRLPQSSQVWRGISCGHRGVRSRVELWSNPRTLRRRCEKCCLRTCNPPHSNFAHACTGVEWNVPKQHSMHQYYTTVDLGETKLGLQQVEHIIGNLKERWPGGAYNLIHHNCCHFADAMAVELGMEHIPRWVNRFARTADRYGVHVPSLYLYKSI